MRYIRAFSGQHEIYKSLYKVSFASALSRPYETHKSCLDHTWYTIALPRQHGLYNNYV